MVAYLRKTRGSQSMAIWGMQSPVPPQLYHSWSALSKNMKPLKVVLSTWRIPLIYKYSAAGSRLPSPESSTPGSVVWKTPTCTSTVVTSPRLFHRLSNDGVCSLVVWTSICIAAVLFASSPINRTLQM